MADRDAILIEFQAFTCLENLEECIAILEQHDWNLEEAVHSTLARLDSPRHDQIPPVVASEIASDGASGISFISPFDIPSVSGLNSLVSNPFNHDTNLFEGAFDSAAASSSTDAQYLRLLDFNIEYRDKSIALVVPDDQRVSKIKELLQDELSIPVSKQELHGWIHKNDSLIQDYDILRDLKLPKKNNLYLLTPDLPAFSLIQSTPSESSDEQKVYELVIKNEDTGDQFSAKFPGSKTVAEVKFDVYPALNMQVRHQVWQGWPDSMRNEKMTLANCGLNFPTHHLQVSSCGKSASAKTENLQAPVEDEMEIESDAEVYDDDLMEDVSRPTALQPLMPNDAEDQTAAGEQFVREFRARYGETQPVFFIGSLEDVLKESLQCKARDRKLLAIYLHHDNSILSNVFCSQILCTDTVVSFLSTNFIVWAWDLTHISNKNILLKHCTTHFGSVAANTVKQFCPDKLPLLLVISRNRGTNEVMEVIDGSCTLNDVMARLIHSLELFKQQVSVDIQEEDERDAREKMLAEQDAAYQESLALDRAKVESKRKEEEERRRIEDVEKQKQEEEEFKKIKAEEEKEAFRQSLANQLPDEPSANCTDATTAFRIRCPEGQTLSRRFLTTGTLFMLMNYITSQGYHVEEYKVLQTYPRRDMRMLDQNLTFAELKIGRQETLTLEKL